jgi:iron complex outermembrane receptor protein
VVLAAVFSVASGTLVLPLGAQSVCTVEVPEAAALPPTTSGAGASDPLARTLSLHAGQITLRAALDLVASTSKLRISYSRELLALDRTVCASLGSLSVGAALVRLVGDPTVQAVVAGPDHVVLAPARAGSPPGEASATPAHPVYQLDEILVDGSDVRAAARSEVVSRTVVSGEELESRGVTTLAQALDVAVPGVWTWGAATAGTTRYGSVRGASSFGVSAPKVYIDGVEAANPLFISQLLPASIERIEVIRGPQGAGLYGADAIGGVVNVVTRRESVGPSDPRARLQSTVGSSSSLFSPELGMSQEHAFSLRAGSKDRSLGLDVGYGTDGEHVPGAYRRSLSAAGNARWVGAHGMIDWTLRFSSESAATPQSPLLAGVVRPGSDEQSLQQYTLGLNGALERGRWTHRATVGLDGYGLRGASGMGGPFLSAADSALRAASGSASRSTLRLSSVGRYQLGRDAAAELTFTAERSALGQLTSTAKTRASELETLASDLFVSSRTGYGLGARADLSWDDRLYLSGGFRMERTDAVAGLGSAATMPMLGAAAVESFGPLTTKLRAAYGKGIRWPQLAALPGVPGSVLSEAVFVGLAPEEQEGVEVGLDVSLGESLALGATRFDQTARGLLQRVASAGAPSVRTRHERPGFGYRFENVGVIDNRGWELQASATHGPLSLQGQLSLVDSRVRRLAEGYAGDLRPGDRVLEVPGRTLGLTAAWNQGGWLASLTASRASDWVGYDRLALARDLSVSEPATELGGERLRGYWRPYEGVTHLGASLSRELFRRFTLTVSGDNLLGYQLGEPDNVTVLPGRTLSIGVRAAF